jgi:hypothetical protein
MKTAFVVATVLVASSGVAKAGGYLGLGIGTSPAVSEDAFDAGPDGRTGRILGGFRFGRFAVEGNIGVYSVQANAGVVHYGVRQLAVAGKYSLPLQDRFEAFGRVGLQHTSLDRDHEGSDYDLSGKGFLIGAGIEYRLDLGVAAGSVFLDYTYNRASLEGRYATTDFTTRMWMLGATIDL